MLRRILRMPTQHTTQILNTMHTPQPLCLGHQSTHTNRKGETVKQHNPSNYCPLCGSSTIIGAHTKPSKKGEWLWTCKKCSKCWDKTQWTATMQWNTDHKVPYLNLAEDYEPQFTLDQFSKQQEVKTT